MRLFQIPGMLLILAGVAVVVVGCGGNSSTAGSASTSMQANWVINATGSDGSGAGTFQASLIPSACSVTTAVGTFTVQGPSCFIADNSTEQGSISGAGSFLYPPQGVLIGVPSNPVPAGSSFVLNLYLVEADLFGDVAVFEGNGTTSGSTMSGSWQCYPADGTCSGLSGTFSGSEQ